MPEKARFYIEVKEPASNLNLQAQISPYAWFFLGCLVNQYQNSGLKNQDRPESASVHG